MMVGSPGMKKDGARVMMKPVVSSQMNKGGVHMKKG